MTLPRTLVDAIDAISPLPAAAWEAVSPLFHARRLATGDHFSTAGQVQREVGLLEAGVMKAAFISPAGRSYTRHLFVPPAVVGDYASLLTGAPVVVAQEALSRCVVWAAPYRALLELEGRFPALVMLHRRFAELLYLAQEQRELELATLDAAARYARFDERFPGLLAAIPRYEVADYLGITPTQLSRIRRRTMSMTGGGEGG